MLSTCVEADAELELLLRHVPDLEVDGGTEEVQGHGGNLLHMPSSIADGKSTSHHVCISNGFDLETKQRCGLVLSMRVGWAQRSRSPIMDPCFEAPDFEGPHSLTSTPSKSQHFIKFALVQVQSLPAPSLPRHNHCFLF